MNSELQKFDERALDVCEAEELVSTILRSILRFEAAVEAGFLRADMFDVLQSALIVAEGKASKLRRQLREFTYDTAFTKTRVNS